jgi:ankyrin repeat protein
MTDHMTDTIQETHDETPPKKKSSTRKILLVLLLAVSPWLYDFISDRIPWSWLDDAEKRTRWLLATQSVDHLELALASGMPIDHKDRPHNGHTLLQFSMMKDGTTPKAFQKKSELIRAMAEAGADLDSVWLFGNTPLAINLRNNSGSDWKKTGDLLIELGADVNGQSGKKKRRYSPLTKVIENCPNSPAKKKINDQSFNTSQARIDLQYLKRGLEPPKPVEKKVPFDPEWKDKIRWLVSHGASFDGDVRVQALGMAISREKSPEVVSLLLELGADPDSGKKSAICFVLHDLYTNSSAYRCRHSSEIVQMLLDAGADVNHGDEKSRPLLSAVRGCCEHNLDVIPMLLKAGANPTFADMQRRQRRGDPSENYFMHKSVIEYARENEALQGTPEMEALEKAVAAANLAADTAKR